MSEEIHGTASVLKQNKAEFFLEEPLLSADHTMLKVLGGTFIPDKEEIEVEVAWNGRIYGVAHINSFFAWNQTVAAGTDLMTGVGFAGASHIPNTEIITIGPGSGPGSTGLTSRRFFVSGLTPGVPVVWELEIGSTGYYQKLELGAGTFPVDLVLSKDSRTLFVSLFTANKVLKYDAGNRWSTDGVLVEKASWTNQFSPHGLAIHPTNDNLIYCSRFGNDTIVELNTVTGAVVRTFNVVDPMYLVVSEDATKLFCTRQGSFNDVVPITLSNGAVGTPIAVGSVPWKPVARGGFIYVACNAVNSIYRINVATHATTTLATGGATTPVALALDPDGTRIWVLEKAGTKRARAIDINTFAFTGDAPVIGLTSGSPNDLFVSPSGRSMVIAGSASGDDMSTYVLPSKGVVYEHASGVDIARLVLSLEGDIYAINNADSGVLQHWHAARLDIDPSDEFWGGFMNVLVFGASVA